MAQSYGAGSTENCRTLVRKALPIQITHGRPCPFPGKSSICRSSENALRLDSGLLNSNYDLGINSPPSSRFLYRTVSECAPILSEPYMRRNDSTSPKTVQLLYGDDSSQCGESSDGCTMIIGIGRETGSRAARNEYTVSSSTRWHVNYEDLTEVNTWEPISALNVPNGDVSVFYLEMNDVMYATPVADPWFAANNGPFNASTPEGIMQLYYGDQPIQALACVQQYQFCNPPLNNHTSCTPLMGIFDAARTASSTIFTSSEIKDMFEWSALAILYMAHGFHEIALIMRGSSLLAGDTLSGLGQQGLPSNQWEIELEHWFKITLADLQQSILDQATGPIISEADAFHSPPTSVGARNVCSNQKIRSDSYTSFNVLGLIIIFSIGSLIMLVSACLPSTTARIQRNRKPFSSLEWISNDTLQLQRLAHEAVGAGDWEGACDDYPRTRKMDRLAVLDIADRKHPVLRVQPKTEPKLKEELDDAENGDGDRECEQEGNVQHENGQRDGGGIEDRAYDSAQTSLLGVEIPRMSLDLSQRFAADMC
ncbi:cytochrome p450 protein [Stemphylium lycopersici]|nr:cytochrome p450 protein [Stemphylium lycopersici]